MNPPRRPRVVILGGGFAGLTAAATLKRAPVDVPLVDRTNHHVFQPLLYQAATAALAPSNIAAPIRFLLRKQKNATTLLADARGIDVERRVVFVDDDRREIPYDFLIVATGARHSYFGHPEWEPFAPGLKSLDDATEIRRRFLLAFENAEKTGDETEREAYLTFIIVGGGPTGVELAGVMQEIARGTLRPDFRRIDTAKTRVLLLEGGPRILPTFPEDLSARAQRDLEKIGVTVRTNAMVTKIEDGAVTVGKENPERIATRTVFWAAGNESSPLGRDLKVPLDKAGRVYVLPDLSVPGHSEIFVAGDLARFEEKEGDATVPWVAQGAIQGGRAAAKNIVRTLKGQPRQPFRYWNKGDLAVIGRSKAVGNLPWGKWWGFPAWLLWLFIHILYLVGFRNRIIVLLEWGYAYVAQQRGVRLITGAAKGNRATPPRAL